MKEESGKLKAYSEGFRHALNILEDYSSALDAYNRILNAGIRIPMSAEEISQLS